MEVSAGQGRCILIGGGFRDSKWSIKYTKCWPGRWGWPRQLGKRANQVCCISYCHWQGPHSRTCSLCSPGLSPQYSMQLLSDKGSYSSQEKILRAFLIAIEELFYHKDVNDASFGTKPSPARACSCKSWEEGRKRWYFMYLNSRLSFSPFNMGEGEAPCLGFKYKYKVGGLGGRWGEVVGAACPPAAAFPSAAVGRTKLRWPSNTWKILTDL